MSIHLSVRRQKVLSNLNKILPKVEVSECYRHIYIYTYICMPHNPIQGQGQGHRGPKVAKMADFIVYFLCQYSCNQKLLLNCNAPRQHVIFSEQFFDIHPRSASRDLQTCTNLESSNDDISGTSGPIDF